MGLGVELGGGAQGESGEGDGAESAHEEEAGGDRDVVGGLRSVVALFCRSEGGMDKIWTSFRGRPPDEVTQPPPRARQGLPPGGNATLRRGLAGFRSNELFRG